LVARLPVVRTTTAPFKEGSLLFYQHDCNGSTDSNAFSLLVSLRSFSCPLLTF